ncbi:MAG TPA: type I restriction-modification enzyme R subunit C-terminal domain-containing protein [Burkholderiales bacterium]|nr:type I restriction-modification enzyme R subunit C-terminal domain-containing protein [Burkholderiales bacterium]
MTVRAAMTFASLAARPSAFFLVRYAMHQDNELMPHPERVVANFKAWLAQQQAAGKAFTDEQRWWLERWPSTSPPTSAWSSSARS